MATHSGILACRIPWTEEPGGLQSLESQRVRQDRATNIKKKNFQIFMCYFVESLKEGFSKLITQTFTLEA